MLYRTLRLKNGFELLFFIVEKISQNVNTCKRVS